MLIHNDIRGMKFKKKKQSYINLRRLSEFLTLIESTMFGTTSNLVTRVGLR